MGFPIKQQFTNPKHGGSRPLSSLNGIVMHYTFGENAGDKGILGLGEGRNVSVHFFIPDDDDASATYTDKTSIYQYLPLTTTGWSVGEAIDGFGNAETISIEVGNRGNEAPTITQLQKMDYLIAYLDKKLGRKLKIVSHAEIALPHGRKSGDPGSNWPMANYKQYRKHTAQAEAIVIVEPRKPVVFNQRATLRANPSYLSKSMGKVNRGQKAYLMAYKGTTGWRKVTTGTIIGWVKSDVISGVK